MIDNLCHNLHILFAQYQHSTFFNITCIVHVPYLLGQYSQEAGGPRPTPHTHRGGGGVQPHQGGRGGAGSANIYV